MVRKFSEHTWRFPRIERGELLHPQGGDAPALTVLRATAGMGKTTAARQLVAHLASKLPAGGHAYETIGAEVDSAWWAAFEDIATAGSEPLVLLIDDAEKITDPQFAEHLLACLETHVRVTAVVAGSFVHGLDTRGPRLRIPVRMVTDAQLRFTAHELAKLVRLRFPTAESALEHQLFDVTRGWPLAVHDGLATAGKTTPPALPGDGIDQFCVEHLGYALVHQSAKHRGALILLAAVDELSSPMLATALEIGRAEADEILADLGRTLLMQRVSGDGLRWFGVHEVMRRVLWRARRQLAQPEQIGHWARRLTLSHEEHRETIAWAEIYGAVDTQNWAELDALLTLHFSDDFIAPPPVLQTQLQSIPEQAKQKFPVLRVASLIEEFAFPRGRRGRVLSEFREMATRTVNTQSYMVGAVGVLSSGMRLGSGRIAGDEATVQHMIAHLRDLIDGLDPEIRLSARTMVATACGQAAIACWYLEEFDAAEVWCQIGRSQFGDRSTTSTAHLAAISAVVAAWRGDIPEAERCLLRCAALGVSRQWANHYVAVSYWIAEALVALEREDYHRAQIAYERVSWRLAINEHWPYMVWINTHLIERQLGAEHALAWLQRQIESHRIGFELFNGPRRALEDLKARLAWKTGRHQLLPARRPWYGLANVYAALADGQGESAASLAASVVDYTSKIGFWRLEARALQLQIIAEQDLGGGGPLGAGSRVKRVLERYQLTTPQLDQAPWSATVDGDAAARAESSTAEPGQGVDRACTRPVGRLTRAELRTIREMAGGGTAVAAAEALNLSVHTVRDHLKSIYRKLGVRNRADAIRKAAAIGVLGIQVP